ncbi:M23 family metallopeptidase [Asticcacaulis sp. YBE204]|uniref:M23 family metallopeptidase n=1 Tax=Asticcacaulis sp. YBE204 TaxID=1282363 RepID=UPI000416D41E|nr:M23 family metallopeptidase [Asticcacaulis sp. YBE204]
MRVQFLFSTLLAAGVGLAGCTVAPQAPKYPIYMQDKPVAEAPSPEKALTPEPPVDENAGVQGLGTKGQITTNELPPPPPPPPPPADKVLAVKTPEPKPAAAKPAVTPSVKTLTAGYVYTLQAQDTLYGVSRRFGVPIQTLYQLNGLTASSVTRIGQKVLLPETAKDKGIEAYANGPAPEKVKTVVAQADKAPAVKPVEKPPVKVADATVVTPAPKPVVVPPTPKPVVKEAEKVEPIKPTPPVISKAFPDQTGIAKLGKGRFVWPYKGNVLVRYGQLGPNVRNDGINIGGPEGAEVVAADEGTVVYVGDQVKELGNTVYIKHANGFYTGYSHLGKVSVKANQKIEQGQALGTLGKTGAVDRAQLHFEIRYTPSSEIAKPFDPTLVLP